MHTDCEKRNKRWGYFPDKISADCNCRSDVSPLRCTDQIKNIASACAEKLFQKLDSCGKSGLFSSQIIAADTGMKCTQRNTQRKNPYQTGGLWLFQNLYCPEIRIAVKKPGEYQGENNRKYSSHDKIIWDMTTGIFGNFFCGSEAVWIPEAQMDMIRICSGSISWKIPSPCAPIVCDRNIL